MEISTRRLKLLAILGYFLTGITGGVIIYGSEKMIVATKTPILIFMVWSGLVLVIVSLIGIYGVIKINFGYTVLSSFALVVVSITLINHLMYAIIKDRSEVESDRKVLKLWNRHMLMGRAMHKIQDRLDCCGIYGFQDYILNDKQVPVSCVSEELVSYIYKQLGCKEASLREYLFSRNFIIFSEFTSLLLNMITAVAGFKLCSRIDRGI
ncbi:uncharacterized protein LOC119685175 [Teleopsis dalmanni]|uniref:uncharacterized protein LOC119685175 n=1 Tax=Teleopsis dalmanni TaxID=139649 RepID=UPI0018CE91EC|nr:uncharacterized protein LOC119685175 [Teleopsis dalmanni]